MKYKILFVSTIFLLSFRNPFINDYDYIKSNYTDMSINELNSNCVECETKFVKDKLPTKLPLKGIIKKYYGWENAEKTSFHCGLDIETNFNSPIYSTIEGIVIKSGNLYGYGNTVIIENTSGVQTLFAHCNRLIVKEKKHVKINELIAYSGQSGNATYSHCHYELRIRETPINPLQYISKLNNKYYNCTPLHLAIEKNDYHLIISLLNKGSDIRFLDDLGIAPITKSKLFGNNRIITLLKKYEK